MSDVRKVERPTRAKVDPLAEATKKWEAGFAGGFPTQLRPASNQPEDRDKSPIEAALDSLHSATHLLDSCISELIRRLETVSLPVIPGVGNERKPASSPMEEAILDRRDDVLAAHNRLRGIIERLQL